MCGRFVTPEQAFLEREFSIVMPPFARSFNVAPTQQVPVLVNMEGQRVGMLMRWGLVPFFARGVPPKYSTINARAETLETAPSFRTPWRRAQRCIVPALGFYEWQVGEQGRKQPFFIHLNDQDVLGFAGLWDRSINPDGAVTLSCTLITLEANSLMSEIHNAKQRMPAILRSEDRDTWLAGNADAARAALIRYPDELMVAYKVSARVNSPRNDDSDLLRPVP